MYRNQDDDLGLGGGCGAGYDGSHDDEMVEAWVARGRMKEMQAKGWRALGPIRDDAVWMRGPDPEAGFGCADDDAWRPLAVSAAAVAAVARLRLRASAAVALRRPHGRRVA